MQRSEAEAVYRAGCEAVVETLLRLDRDVQRLSERLLPYARRSARDRRQVRASEATAGEL
jgi:hypothetical protein